MYGWIFRYEFGTIEFGCQALAIYLNNRKKKKSKETWFDAGLLLCCAIRLFQ
jgi:hypothetical protein